MSRLSFNHQQKKRKTWLFPLIVIILLYISIPFLLINSGTKAIDTAIVKMGSQDILLPEKQYITGVMLINFAEMFPGFSNWSKQIRKGSNKKIIIIYRQKCRAKSQELFQQISGYEQEFDSLNINFEYTESQMYMAAAIFKGNNKENLKILVSKEQKDKLEKKFCAVWADFFNKIKTSPVNNSICPQ